MKVRPNMFVVDIGKKMTHYYNTNTKEYGKIEHSDFLDLNIPDISNGDIIVVEAAHLMSQEENSLAQAFKIDQLRQLRNLADSKNNSIRLFPQKVTPKARKVASLINEELLEKTDENDVKSIAYYLQEFSNVFSTLKEFVPYTLEEHESKVSHIYDDRNLLTEQSNAARNEGYGIKTDYSDPVTEWIKRRINVLASRLDNETREWVGLEYKKDGSALLESFQKYTNGKLKFIYGIVLTVLDSETGKPRVRSDNGLPPYWKYAKQVYFGLTPYHMHAGVKASDYKYHKRKAGSSCKKSMSLESKNKIKSIDDVFEIRESMKYSDKQLRNLWREVRKMIVEEGLR